MKYASIARRSFIYVGECLEEGCEVAEFRKRAWGFRILPAFLDSAIPPASLEESSEAPYSIDKRELNLQST